VHKTAARAASGPQSYAQASASPTSSRGSAARTAKAPVAKAPRSPCGPPPTWPDHSTGVHQRTCVFVWPTPPPEDRRKVIIRDLRLGFSAEQYAVWWMRRGNLAVTAAHGAGPAPGQALWDALFTQCTLDPAYAGSFSRGKVFEDGLWSQVVVCGVPAALANTTTIKTAVSHVFTGGSPSEAAAAVVDVRSLIKPNQDDKKPRTICILFTWPKIAAAVIRNGLALEGFLYCVTQYRPRRPAAQAAA
jgi:hypothetical protein